MVMDFGMSRLGRVTYRESGRSPFLTGQPEYPRERSHSEHTAREIDEEIKRILDESLEKVRHILQTRRQALVAIAGRLMEKEVIDTEELHELIEANSPNPQIVPGTEIAKRPPKTEPSAEPAAAEPGGAAG
jgi:cell division protease FtsH